MFLVIFSLLVHRPAFIVWRLLHFEGWGCVGSTGHFLLAFVFFLPRAMSALYSRGGGLNLSTWPARTRDGLGTLAVLRDAMEGVCIPGFGDFDISNLRLLSALPRISCRGERRAQTINLL